MAPRQRPKRPSRRQRKLRRAEARAAQVRGSPGSASLVAGAVGRQAYKQRLRQEQRGEMASALPPLASTLAVLYTLLAIVAVWRSPPEDLPILLPSTLGVAFLFYLLRLGALDQRGPSGRTIPLAFVTLLLVLIPSAAYLFATGDPIQTTTLVIVALGSGALLLHLPVLIIVQGLIVAVFAVAVVLEPGAPNWVYFGIALAVSIVIGFVLYAVRMRGLRRLLDLRIADERHKTVLSRSLNEAQESERRFRLLSSAAFEGILAVRGDRIRDINPEGAAIFGRTPEELVGTRAKQLGRTDDGQGLLEAVAAQGDDVHEIRFHTIDDKVIDLEARSRSMRYRGEDALVVTLRDVTERRRFEAERARLTRELQLILDSTAEGIIGLDQKGAITFANRAAARILGTVVDALAGRPHEDILHPEACDPDECPFIGSYQKGVSAALSETAFPRGFGGPIPVDLVVAPIMDDESVQGAVVAFRDITERLEVERIKDEFVSVVSHELKTPLTSMHGALQLLVSGRIGDIPPQGEKMLKIAADNTGRLIRLVNDILDVERFRAGKVTLEPRATDAASLAQKAYDTMSPMAEAQRVTLHTSTEAIALTVDPDRILQALTNLLSNAIKFSPEGGRITLHANRKGADVVFAVEDEGPGIPPEQLDSVFERFHQVDSSHAREKGGTGLGLSIVRSIAEAHGGEVGLESELGKGSTFSIRVPINGPTSKSRDPDTNDASPQGASQS